MPRYRGSLPFVAAMNESPYSQYDCGEDGMVEECRSCRFHRQDRADRTSVFPRCPYSPNKESTHRPKPQPKWKCTYVKNEEEKRNARHSHSNHQSEGRHG